MSRIAKYPVEVPKGVEVTLTATEVVVKGPLGTLKQFMLPAVTIEKDGEQLQAKASDLISRKNIEYLVVELAGNVRELRLDKIASFSHPEIGTVVVSES